MIFVVRNAVKHGYMQAILSIMGNLSCQAVIIFLVAMGAGAILEQSPVAFFILKIMGGLYLIYLGVTGLMKKPKNTEETEPAPVQQTSFFKTGFLVSASNPKTVIFLSAFLPQFISVDYPVTVQFGAMFFTICAIVISVHLAYSYAARNIQKAVSNTRAGEIFSRIYNGVFIAFGGGLIFSNK